MDIERPKSKQPIPAHAKRVFSGRIFDVYQWEQEMFDGTLSTFEKIKRPNTLMVIPTIGDKIIISKQEQPGHKRDLGFLGGRQNPNESPESGAKRELLEESGLSSADWELYKTFEPHAKLDWILYYFVARDCQKVQEQNLDAGEKIRTFGVNFDEFIDLILQDNFYGTDFALHIAQLKIRNRLDELRNLLFKK